MNTVIDIDTAVAEQRAYFDTGATIDIDNRVDALVRLRKAIRHAEPRIAEALAEDLGKSSQESFMCEIGLALSELRHHLAHLRSWAKPQPVRTDIANFPAKSFTVAEPYGVVLVMAPWNYPFLLCIEPLIGAIAAGNCCVVKPSAYAPATSRVVAEIVAESFDPSHVCVVQGGRDENAALLEQRFDYIFFTGSTTVGKLVMQKAATHLTPVSLELGGKSPCIVAADADIDLAAKRIVFGKYLNCGQTCVAPDYALVDARIHDEFVEALKRHIARMFGANPLENPHYGRIVNRKHFGRLLGLIEPAKTAFGGAFDADALRIEPTVMTNVDAGDAIMQEEIFGPILPVIAFEETDEAERFVKSMPKPLALYLFTDDAALQDRFLRHVPFGGGCINDTVMHLATSHMGFGGVGASGMGSYHGKKSFDTFSHEKSILKKGTWLDVPLRYQPYSKTKEAIIRTIMR
ncbi:MAG: aldehyde dehydrogenase [Slackia sp.]|nr:aldehyde dehydrogenase [Slackia sp.]